MMTIITSRVRLVDGGVRSPLSSTQRERFAFAALSQVPPESSVRLGLRPPRRAAVDQTTTGHCCDR